MRDLDAYEGWLPKSLEFLIHLPKRRSILVPYGGIEGLVGELCLRGYRWFRSLCQRALRLAFVGYRLWRRREASLLGLCIGPCLEYLWCNTEVNISDRRAIV